MKTQFAADWIEQTKQSLVAPLPKTKFGNMNSLIKWDQIIKVHFKAKTTVSYW